MPFSTRIRPICSIVLALGLWACGSDTTGPNADNFDAESTTAALEVVDGTFETAAFSSLEAMGGAFVIPAAASPQTAQILRAATHPESEDFVQRVSKAATNLLSSSTAALVLIPEECRGLTLTYSSDVGYSVAETRTDAPANGVRFILYAVNPVTHEVSEPLTEIGYADITDESTETVAAIGLAVVSDGTTYLDYSITISGTLVSPTFTLDGFITDGVNRADFSLTHSYVVDVTGVTTSIDYEISVDDFSLDVALEMIASGNQDPAVEVAITFSEGSDTVTISGSLEAGAGTLDVRGNGVLLAVITIESTSVTVTNGEGESLSQQEIETLKELTEIIDEAEDTFENLVGPVEFLLGS